MDTGDFIPLEFKLKYLKGGYNGFCERTVVGMALYSLECSDLFLNTILGEEETRFVIYTIQDYLNNESISMVTHHTLKDQNMILQMSINY